MNTQQTNYIFLTQAPVHKVIHKMAIPTIISMLITNLYNLADTFFVGNINTQCTAAIGISFSIMAIIQAFGFFFGHGSGNFISRQLGAKNIVPAEKMAATALFYSICFGILISFIGIINLTQLSLWLGSTPTILPYTEQYLGIILLGTPFMTGSLTLNNQMRFQGNAKFAMFGVLSGAILNIILDPILIFCFNMGIRGAAIATVTSQIFGFVFLLMMSKKGNNLRIRRQNITFSKQYIKEIFMGGTPSLSRQGLGSLSTILLNLAAGTYGDAAIAGMSIVTRISFFVYSVVIGLGQGFQPLCGFCFGAKLYDRVHKGFMYSVKVGTIFLTLCAILGFIFSDIIIELFRNDPDVIKVGIVTLRWQLLAYPFITYIVATNMLMQTIRKAALANLVASARSGLFFIPLILILPHILGLLGVEMCQAVSDICAFLISYPIARKTFKGFKNISSTYS